MGLACATWARLPTAALSAAIRWPAPPALATLNTLQEQKLPQRAARLGAHLLAQLERIDSPLIHEVRGLGLLVGIDLGYHVTPILQGLQARGILALPAGSTVLRLLPPLVI